MEQLLMGAVAAGSLIVGLIFCRFWRQTRDRLFLYFAGSFALEALNRVVLALVSYPDEREPLFYLVRLFAYSLIVVAIWQKNFGDR